MLSITSAAAKLWRFDLVARSFQQQPGLPFAEALPEAHIEQAFSDEGSLWGEEDDEVVYTPAVTLWAFLSQVLFTSAQRSCVAAVARVAVLWAALGKQICASNTGAYCRARAKLSEPVLQRLTREVAEHCEGQVPKTWLWHGRHVRLCDGTTISLPDTEANQAEYPQSTSQARGLGFPLIRLVVLFSYATGMLQEIALAPYAGKETGETSLLRQLLDRFQAGDILLADKCYCGWFLIALLQELGVDVVTLLHQMREADFTKGIRLGPKDHLVEWPRPDQPEWMEDATYARMPDCLRLREIEVQVTEPGFRTKSLVIVTTLRDATTYTREDLAELYRGRWHVELNLRTVKSTLQLDVLRCRTPEMARKELWIGLLAYNLIRQTMLQAALEAECSPRELSFTAALQTIASAWMIGAITRDHLSLLVQLRLNHMARHRVGNRPDRIEPRAIKRRPKQHDLLTVPRKQARAKLLAGKST